MNLKDHHDLIRQPVITEKSTILGEDGKYVFKVSKEATKANLKMAVEKIFSVKVKKVNILNQEGKQKRFKGQIGRRSDYKKAIVTLEKDHSIDLAGGIK